MYDEVVKNVDLTADEIELLITLLESEVDNCLTVGEEITINELIEKLK